MAGRREKGSELHGSSSDGRSSGGRGQAQGVAAPTAVVRLKAVAPPADVVLRHIRGCRQGMICMKL